MKNMNCSLILIAIITIISIANTDNPQDHTSSPILQNTCHIPPAPKNIALWTMTRLRIGPDLNPYPAITFFKQFLNHYASMQCPIYNSIYFIWNNEQTPEQLGITIDNDTWQKKVYFIHTAKNSLDNRYLLPSWVSEQLFINLDDDAMIDCGNLTLMYSQWLERSVGSMGPLGSNYGRNIVYNEGADIFEYTFPGVKKNVFNIALTGASIISKHFMLLYYADLYEFRKMRQMVRELFNCEDMAINFMINYFYATDFRSFRFDGVSMELKPSAFEISLHTNSNPKRKNCSKQFVELFGYSVNPFIIIEDTSQQYKEKRTDKLLGQECLLYMKKAMVERRYFSSEQYWMEVRGVYGYGVGEGERQVIERDNAVLRLNRQEKKRMVGDGVINVKYDWREEFQQVFPQVDAQQYVKPQETNQPKEMNTTDSKPIEQAMKTSQQRNYITPLLLTVIVIQLLLLLLCSIKLYQYSRNKQLLNPNRKPDDMIVFKSQIQFDSSRTKNQVDG